jgi:hypothetical protein
MSFGRSFVRSFLRSVGRVGFWVDKRRRREEKFAVVVVLTFTSTSLARARSTERPHARKNDVLTRCTMRKELTP